MIARTNIGFTKIVMAFVISLASTLMGHSASADSLTWDFSNPLGNVGSNTHIYSDMTSTATIVAWGEEATAGPGSALPFPHLATVGQTWGPSASTYSTAGLTGDNLYGKFTSGDPTETGLGLNVGSTDHEIQNNSFVQLDLKFVEDNHYTGLAISVSSIQTGEGFYVWGSNTQGTPGTLLYVGTNPPGGTVQNTPLSSSATFLSYRYIAISATYASGGSDVLLKNGLSITPSGSTTPMPLPSSVLSGGLLLGLLFGTRIARRRRGARVGSTILSPSP